MDRLLQILLGHYIKRGSLRLTTSRGTVMTFGDGTGKPVAIRFATRATEWAILRNPELTFGEAYMDGSLIVEQGTIADVLEVVMRQQQDAPPRWARVQWLFRFLRRRLLQFNPRRRSRENVAHH
jgi:cyclopropane-fatty-acyl-phospholipid synthase